MEIITSIHNIKIKQLLKLAQSPRTSKKSDLTLFEGTSLISDYLTSGFDYEVVIFDQSKMDNFEIRQLINRVPEDRLLIVVEHIFSKLTQVQTSPGALVIIKRPRPKTFVVNSDIGQNILLFDRIQDPGNLGTILRTALAVGLKTIVLSAGSVDAFSPKVIRASMGAVFKLNIYEQQDLRLVISQVKPDYQVMVTSSHAKKNIFQLKLTSSTAWLLGNEGSGVDEALFMLADQKVIIPQEPEVESLNLATATSICLYEQYRQLHY